MNRVNLPPSIQPGNVAPRSDAEEELTLDIAQVQGILWHGKWLILLITSLALSWAVYYVYVVATPKYQSMARLALDTDTSLVVDIDSIVSGVSSEEEAINTELEVIESRGLILKLIDEMNLMEDPEFNATLRPAPMINTGKAIDFVKAQLGFAVETQQPLSDYEKRLGVAKEVRDVIDSNAYPNTYIYSITTTTADPQKSAEMANTLATLYLRDMIEVKFDTSQFATDFLSERVTELELELKEKEDAIKDLRAETELVSLESLEALAARSKNLRRLYTEAESTAGELDDKLARVLKMVEERDFVALSTEYTDRTDLFDLSNRAASGDAEAAETFMQEIEDLRQANILQGRRARLQAESLLASYSEIEEEIAIQNEDLIELNQLMRESEATKVLYETFLARFKEASVQVGLLRADSRVLDEAIPGVQVAPRKTIICAVALFLGFVLSIIIIVVRLMMKNTFRNALELERFIGVNVLGQIPLMPVRRRGDLLKYLKSKPASAASESVRNMRTSLLMSNIDKPPQIILSTSSIPGEGKTTQSVSLAYNLSGLGKKVLLIEGDIRRLTLDNYFDNKKSSGSLITVVSGQDKLEDAVYHDEEYEFDVLMGSDSNLNAADFFSSERFENFVSDLREEYDFVIIDTPPVLVVPDARVLGKLVDCLIYSVKWDSTSKLQVLGGIKQLSSVGIPIAGAVLCQIDPKRMKRYGYQGDYGAYADYGKQYYNN